MTNYKLVKKIAEHIYLLDSKYGQQLFSRCKLRKNTQCDQFSVPLKKGMYAYRPTTNGYNRMVRISEVGMASIINP